mmetsp:Transcript_30097/g.54705  ORF Transcript_30097/g.54705 Transcript_30097/m.54705 type:complete len:207 (+) Transcript_30097:205-825(+)
MIDGSARASLRLAKPSSASLISPARRRSRFSTSQSRGSGSAIIVISRAMFASSHSCALSYSCSASRFTCSLKSGSAIFLMSCSIPGPRSLRSSPSSKACTSCWKAGSVAICFTSATNSGSRSNSSISAMTSGSSAASFKFAIPSSASLIAPALSPSSSLATSPAPQGHLFSLAEICNRRPWPTKAKQANAKAGKCMANGMEMEVSG